MSSAAGFSWDLQEYAPRPPVLVCDGIHDDTAAVIAYALGMPFENRSHAVVSPQGIDGCGAVLRITRYVVFAGPKLPLSNFVIDTRGFEERPPLGMVAIGPFAFPLNDIQAEPGTKASLEQQRPMPPNNAKELFARGRGIGMKWAREVADSAPRLWLTKSHEEGAFDRDGYDGALVALVGSLKQNELPTRLEVRQVVEAYFGEGYRYEELECLAAGFAEGAVELFDRSR